MFPCKGYAHSDCLEESSLDTLQGENAAVKGSLIPQSWDLEQACKRVLALLAPQTPDGERSCVLHPRSTEQPGASLLDWCAPHLLGKSDSSQAPQVSGASFLSFGARETMPLSPPKAKKTHKTFMTPRQ